MTYKLVIYEKFYEECFEKKKVNKAYLKKLKLCENEKKKKELACLIR